MSSFLIRSPYSLITELLHIYNGKYIVRAIFKVDEVTLASGLGSGETVEEAEDKAQKRALAIVDIEQISHPLDNPPSPTTTVKTDTYLSDFPQPSFLSNISFSSRNNNLPAEPESQQPFLNSSPANEDLDESDEFIADIIAQIDIEINRLGWTKEQGRDCLLQNYGKKSRLLLSNQELQEFLQYLQTQTTP